MGKIIVTQFVSVDGVSEAPGGEPDYPHTGWVARFPEPEPFDFLLNALLPQEALLIGRVTYESFAGAWPGYEGPMADKMNAMPKFVASRTLKNPEWNNTTVLEGDLATAVAQLKRQIPGEIAVQGSRSIVNQLRRHGLVDEYRLMVFPVVLGSGRRLFDETPEALELKLRDAVTYHNGVVLLVYEAGTTRLD